MKGHRSRGTARLLGLLLGAACLVPVLPAPSALAAVETWSWPDSGELAVSGHGFGHGRGLSQWGARGAASEGLSAEEILAHYYPGTIRTTVSESTLRVLVSGGTDDATDVVPASGLRVETSSGTQSLPATLSGQDVTRWRVVRSSAGMVVEGLTGSTWRTLSVGGQTGHASPVSFSTSNGADPGVVRVVRDVVVDDAPREVLREYRGDVRAVASGSTPNLVTVVASSVSDYLQSVVPAEMPAGWHQEALRAQAVAARTYALFDAQDRPVTSPYDTCDTTQCQVFNGAAEYALDGTLLRRFEYTATNTAVAATAGRVVTYARALAFTQFSASNGGWTADGGRPYLTAYPDPYDGVYDSTAHSWTATVKASSLESAYPAIGTLRSVSLERDGRGEWGGRVTSVTLTGSLGSTTITGDRFRSVTGLRSTWWAPSSAGWAGYDLVVGPGDWNGDRAVDLVARDEAGLLWVQPGTGSGTMAPRQQIGNGWGSFTALVGPGDWNGDNRADLIARTSDGRLLLYPGNGTGGFTASRQIGNGWGSFTTLVGPGDWDGDNRNDLIARTSDGRLLLYPGNGTGGFTASRQIGSP